MTATIPLSQGLVALVDDEDIERVLALGVWSAFRVGHTAYAQHAMRENGRQRNVLLHRVVLDAQPGQEIDHINGNGLDNQKANLRLVSRSQNMANQRKTRGASRFKGVWWDKVNSRWVAHIRNKGRSYFLGRYVSEEDAARAYDTAAIETWGEYARPNFPRP